MIMFFNCMNINVILINEKHDALNMTSDNININIILNNVIRCMIVSFNFIRQKGKTVYATIKLDMSKADDR